VSFVYDANVLNWLCIPTPVGMLARFLNSFLESLILAQDERWRRA
jgi:hypothetical protein